MKKICVLCSVLLMSILSSTSYGEQLLLPQDQAIVAQDVAWNKWTTKNFVILSYDKAQGQYLAQNIEGVKEWLMERWGLPAIDFKQECRVFCVPTREKMKTFFGIEGSYSETRNGLSILWLVLDELPPSILPSALTGVCLTELSDQYDFAISFWSVRGMMHLNATLPQIHEQLQYLQIAYQNDERLFFGNLLFSTDAATWNKQPKAIRDLFDAQAMVACLLLRREYGQRKLTRFLRSGGTERSLQRYLGFQDFNDFDQVFNRYMKHLLTDEEKGAIPDKYLQITKV